MDKVRRLSAGEKICRNCRYLSCTKGDDLRCADPASADFDRPVAALGTCGRFQISFEAVRRLASEQRVAARAEIWDMTMARRASVHRIGP